MNEKQKEVQTLLVSIIVLTHEQQRVLIKIGVTIMWKLIERRYKFVYMSHPSGYIRISPP